MTKVIVEKDGLRVEASQVSSEGIAKIIDIIFHESQSVGEIRAREVREDYRAARIDKIQAIKQVRDATGMGLKESKDFVEVPR